MSTRNAYLYNQAGQAVAAAHQRLTIRVVSGDPARATTDIVVPRGHLKARMIMWLAGMAAEKKGVGRSNPLRRIRNRARVRAQIEMVMAELKGSRATRLAQAKLLLNQSQDRANAICNSLYEAIREVAARLRAETLSGDEVCQIVASAKKKRRTAARASRKPEERGKGRSRNS